MILDREHLVFLIAMGIFVTIVLLIQGIFVIHSTFYNPELQRTKRRLRVWSEQRNDLEQLRIVRIPILSQLPWLNTFLARFMWVQGLRRLIQQAGLQSPPGLFIGLSALLATLMFSFTVLTKAHLAARLALALIAAVVPFLYLILKRKQRMKQFERQFPEALEMMARAMQAGHAFIVGLKMVAEEMADPISVEFEKAVEEINFGVEMTEALKNMVHRVDSQDLKLFVTSLIVQKETGGNLVEMLQAISRVIRQRFELQARVQALSAQARLSASILEALPFVTGLAIYLQSRDYLAPLVTDPLGRMMVGVSGLLLILGILELRRMVSFQV
jgi:tight adherence protein B